ncbi:hypothetical protein [Mycoplasmopsis glycophila]|uniref:Uncharacterized protein n=1 Tax=Mycoplasmopsis glycophila TaxID=171285 RepID=A0A449AV69_9BACT|nr:hypothetical protein [Mycoplasmopsis glycophila]VEU70383.1 Uncharacterised protein [Mycoplasmopsis glycophila]
MNKKSKKILGGLLTTAAIAAAGTTTHLLFVKEGLGMDPDSFLITLGQGYASINNIANSVYFKGKLGEQLAEKSKEYNSVLNDKNLTEKEKIEKLSEIINSLAQEVSQNITPDMSKQDLEAVKNLIQNQKKLLRESTLKNNFDLGPTIELEKAFNRYQNDSSYDLSQALQNYQNELQKNLEKQNLYLQDAEILIRKANEFSDEFPYENLKKNFLTSVNSLDSYIKSNEFSLNELETKATVIQNKLNELEELKVRVDKKVTKGDALAEKANEILNSISDPKIQKEIQDAIQNYSQTKANLNSEAELDEAIRNLETTLLKESDYRKSPEELKQAIRDFVNTEDLDIFDDLLRENVPNLDELPNDVTELATIKKQIHDKYNQLKVLEDEFKDVEGKIDVAYDKKILSDIDKLKLDNLEEKFKAAPNVKEAQKILEQMKKDYENAVKDSKVIMDELDNLKNDIKWLSDQENLKDGINTDLNELLNKIDATNEIGTIPVAQLKGIYKAWTLDLKNKYLDQVQNLNDQIQDLKELYLDQTSPYNQDMLAQINDFQDLATKLSNTDNPITIRNLKDAIEKMNAFLAVKPVIDKYIDTQELIDDKKLHLNDVFNENNDPNYVPGEVQKNYENNLEKLREEANTLREKLNPENKDEIAAALDEIQRKVLENTEKAILAQKSLDEIERSEKLFDRANTLSNLPKAEMDNVQAKKDALEAVLNNPNATKEELDKAYQDLKEANDALNDAILAEEQNQMFENLRQKIYDTFPNAASGGVLSPIEQALLDKLENVKENYARDRKNPDNIAKTKEDLAKLEQLLPSLKELQDTQMQALEPAISNSENSPYKGAYSNAALPEGYDVQAKIDDIVGRINSDSIPDTKEISSTNNEALDATNNINVATSKDKLIKLNEQIQDQSISNPATLEEAKLNEGIQAIDAFVQDVLANKTQANDVLQAEKKVEALNPLVEQLKKANDLIRELEADQGDTDKNQKLIDQIKQAIAENGINLADSPSAIDNKTENLKDFLAKELAKKELNNTINDEVQKLLDKIEDKSIQSEVAKKLEELKNSANILIDSENATPEDILAKNAEILEELQKAKEEIQQNKDDYQAKIDKIENLKQLLDPKKNANPDNYPNYIEAIQSYEDIKDLGSTTLKDLDDKLKEIQFAFDKDEAIKAANDLKAKVNDANTPFANPTADSPQSGYLTLKNGVNTYTQKVLDELNDESNNYSNYNPKEAQEKIEAANDLFTDQKSVAERLAQLKEKLNELNSVPNDDRDSLWESNQNKIELDIANLENMLTNSIVLSTDDKSNIENKQNELNKAFEEYKTFEIKRNNLIDRINDLKDRTNDKTSAYDPKLAKQLNDVYNKMIENANDALSDADLQSIEEQLNTYNDKLPTIASFAEKVSAAYNYMNSPEDPNDKDNPKRPTSPEFTELKKQIENLIQEGEKLSSSSDANSAEIQTKIEEINKLVERAAIFESINKIIDEALAVNENIDYYTYNGQDSDIKKEEVKNWLNRIQQDAFNQTDTELLRKIKETAKAAKGLVDKYKEISSEIQTYKNKAIDTSFKGYDVDAQLLIDNLWENTAKKPFDPKNPNSSLEEIQKSLEKLEVAKTNVAQIDARREKLYDLIKAYKEDSVNGLNNSELNSELQTALEKRVNNILNNNAAKSKTKESLDQDIFTDEDGKEKLLMRILQPNFINLSKAATEAEAEISKTVSTDSKLTNKLNELSENVKKAKRMYSTETKAVSIDQLTEKLKINILEVKILIDYQNIKEKISSSSISESDKAPIEALYSQFDSEFAALSANEKIPTSDELQAIKNKYLIDATSYLSVTTPSDHLDPVKNNIILQVFEDTKELRKIINLANEYYNERQKEGDSNIIDTEKVKELYKELHTLIEQAETEIAKKPNSEDAKAHRRYDLQNKIEQIRLEKLKQAKSLLIETEKLYNEMTELGWTPYKTSNYETKAINDLKSITKDQSGQDNSQLPDNVTIKDVNLKIYYANKELNNQKRKIWEAKQNKFNDEYKKLDILVQAFNNTIARSGIDIKQEEYDVIKTLKNQLQERGTISYEDISKWNEESFNTRYPSTENSSYSLFTQEIQMILKAGITQIETAINTFNAIYIENMKSFIGQEQNRTKGIIRDFKETIAPFINSSESNKDSLFKQLGMGKVINIFNNTFITAYEKFLGSTTETNYNDLITNTDPQVMVKNSTELNDLKKLLKDLVSQIQEDFKDLYTIRANLNQIITDLDTDINTERTAYWAARTLYAQAYNKFKNLVDNLVPDFMNIGSKTPANPGETLAELKARQKTYIQDKSQNIVTTINESKKFFDWLEDNINNEELSYLVTQANSDTDKFDESKKSTFENKPRKLLLLNEVINKYLEIQAKETTRYNEFTNKINVLGSDSATQEMDITTSRDLMSLFKKFKFSSIDSGNIFNLDNFRIILKRRSDNTWYELEDQNNDYSKTKVKFSVVYKFTPKNADNFDNLNDIEFASDELSISFKTSSILQIPSGRNIFVTKDENGQDVFGQNAKQSVINMKDTGWFTSSKTDEQLLNEFWNGLSDKIFGGLGSSHAISISDEDYQKAHNATDASELTGADDKVAKLIKEEKLGLKILIPVSNAFSGSWTNIIESNNGRYKVYLSPDDKEMIVYGIYPSKPITQDAPYPTKDGIGDKDLPFKQAYGNLFVGTDIYKAMPQVEVFKWVFKFEIDETTKEVKSYIKHLESRNFTKVRSLMVDGYNSLGSNDTDKQVWSADKFAEFVHKNNLVFKENDSNLEFNVPSSTDYNSLNNFTINYNNQPALKYILNPQDSVFGSTTTRNKQDLKSATDDFKFFQRGIDRMGGTLIENGTIKTLNELKAVHWPYSSDENKAHGDAISNILSIPYQSTIQEFKFQIKD